MRKSVVFLGGKRIGSWCLQHLIAVQQSLNFHIVGVIPSRNQRLGGGKQPSVIALARQAKIPVWTELDALLSIEPVDFIISVQYDKILRTCHIQQAREIAVNLHMAPLPEYRGCNQFSFAIVDQINEFGTTIHRIEESIDGGAIIAERRFPIPEGCWVDELYAITEQESLLLFKETLPKLIAGDYVLIPQATLMGKRSMSYHRRSDIEQLKRIDLEWPRDKIERYIRATAMPGFEPPYVVIGGRKVYLIREDQW